MLILNFLLTGLGVIGWGIGICFGFWIGKKLTNLIDELIFCHSKEFKQMVQEGKAALAVG